MKCEHCDKEYVEERAKKRHFCSKHCMWAHYKAAKRHRPLVVKTCKHCGKLFETRSTIKIYCSEECRVGYDSRSEWPQEAQCAVCGKTYMKTGSRNVYCSGDCRYQRQIARNRRTSISKTCAKCGDNFLAKSARTAHCPSCLDEHKRHVWRTIAARHRRNNSRAAYDRPVPSANISSVQHCPADQLERLICRIVKGEVEYYHNGVTA